MKNKIKKLWFTNDFSRENVEKLQADGWMIRNASAVKDSDFVEQADEYGGDVPASYQVKNTQLTVSIGITPELQQTLDNAKAECEQVVSENDGLKQEVENLKAQIVYIQSKPADTTGFVPIEQFDAVAEDLAITKALLESTQIELTTCQNSAGAMKVRITELEQVNNPAETEQPTDSALVEEKPKATKAK